MTQSLGGIEPGKTDSDSESLKVNSNVMVLPIITLGSSQFGSLAKIEALAVAQSLKRLIDG